VISSKHLLSDASKQTNLAKQNLKRLNNAVNINAVIESIRAEQRVRHFVAEVYSLEKQAFLCNHCSSLLFEQRAAMRLVRSARRRFDVAAKRVLTAHSATQVQYFRHFIC
jgi:hypothetical protein